MRIPITRLTRYSVYRDHGSNPPCGEGHYLNFARGGINISGIWKGEKDVSSNHHYFHP